MLTLKTIVRTFNIQGLPLKENKLKSPEEFNLSGIKPSIFSIGESKDILLIYIFKSFTERDKMLMETDKFNNTFSLEEIPYNAKNALIVYMPFELPKTEEDYKSLVKTKSLIFSTVFKSLNGGKEIVYKGESENWQGTYTLKYYQHWAEDEKGIHYDGHSWKYPVIKYKMPNIDDVGPITFEYDGAGGSGKITGAMLNKDGYVNVGSSSGSGAMPDENDNISFTIKWGDKEEHIVLKAE